MSLESQLALIESIKHTSVVFVGDSITDEYVYVKPLGKSPKENLIPVEYVDAERFNGGTQAAASHLLTFCANVEVSTGGNQIRKTRYIDKTYLRKMFEVHHVGAFQERKYVPEADITVVTDFGHGYITPAMIDKLCERKFLAVNAQTNSSNIGYNLITKYPKADYAVLDEPEARLAMSDRESTIETVMAKLARNRFKRLVVTHGRNGAYGFEDGKFYHCEAFTDRVLDTMGAGDAFFAITAPMAKTGSMKDLLVIGNAAGALKTQIVGHKKSVTKTALIEFLKGNHAA